LSKKNGIIRKKMGFGCGAAGRMGGDGGCKSLFGTGLYSDGGLAAMSGQTFGFLRDFWDFSAI
jgi:hypothetical protein